MTFLSCLSLSMRTTSNAHKLETEQINICELHTYSFFAVFISLARFAYILRYAFFFVANLNLLCCWLVLFDVQFPHWWWRDAHREWEREREMKKGNKQKELCKFCLSPERIICSVMRYALQFHVVLSSIFSFILLRVLCIRLFGYFHWQHIHFLV